MATIYGQSQAWQAVTTKLNLSVYSVDSPQALRELCDRLERHQPEWRNHAEQFERHRIAELQTQLRTYPDQIAQQEREAQNRIGPAIDVLQRQYAALFTEPRLFRRLFNRWLIAPRVRTKISRAQAALRNAAYPLRLAQQSLARQVTTADATFSQTVASLVEKEAHRLARIHHALSSPEFAGAIMELEVAQILAALSDDFHVFHDLKLKLKRSVQFQNKWLTTAQIDHLVVGPTGVFVIETKNWSREFVAHGKYFDPFEQVARARFLCQCDLRDYGLSGLVVRDILANAGAHLDKPEGSFTRILRPSTLNTHIENRPSELSMNQITRIVAHLHRCLAE